MSANEVTPEEYKKTSSQSDLEVYFWTQCQQKGFPEPDRQRRWHPTRKWLADFVWYPYKLIVEIQGAVYKPHGGRHTLFGYEDDCVKMIEAQHLGYGIFFLEDHLVKSGKGVIYVERHLLTHGWPPREVSV